MNDSLRHHVQMIYVDTFQDFISTQFYEDKNAICWKRNLEGDFAEIVHKLTFDEPIIEIEEEDLQDLKLSKKGQIARQILLSDINLMRTLGVTPSLNLIQKYERDDENPVFPTDVYSYHIDRSTVPFDTILCTYFGASSQILPNAEAEQKIRIPKFSTQLQVLYDGAVEDFESFISENFYDLHYQALPDAQPIT
ncbi:MAG TPA: hypothetical protein PKD85_09490, partial [Saprospiraceae bacterium]|nr:hypothetical protein [Saprospiraceae bacterium]